MSRKEQGSHCAPHLRLVVDNKRKADMKYSKNREIAKAMKEAGIRLRYPTPIPRAEWNEGWRETIQDLRMLVSLVSPLIAYQMYQCDIEFSYEIPSKSACAAVTPTRNVIYFYPEFFESLNQSGGGLVLMHEVLHIFLEHGHRGHMMGYDQALWAAAIDYYVNPVCLGMYRDEDGNVHQHNRNRRFSMPRDEHGEMIGLYDEEFIGLSADEIYWKMIENCGGDKKKAQEKYAGGGLPEPGEEDGIFGPGQGEGGKLFDWMPMDEPVEGEDAAGVRNQINKNRQTAAAAVAQAERSPNGIGEHEAGLARYIREMTKPVIRWTDVVMNLSRAAVKERSSYNRLSRRSQGEIIFPSKEGEMLRAIYGVDTSGSMGHEELAEAASEFHGILEQFMSWEVRLTSCDVHAHDIDFFTSQNADEFSAHDIRLIGGGGTDMTPLISDAKYRMAMGEEIDLVVVVTDGYVPEIKEEMGHECQYVFLITSNGNRGFHPEGATVLYLEDMKK